MPVQLRTLPRAVVARYARPVLKQLLRRLSHRLRQAVRRVKARYDKPRLLAVFGGRTSYWPGAGAELYAQEPAFSACVQECERLTTLVLKGPSVLAHFTGEAAPDFFADEARLLHTSVVMQLALVALWHSRGVQPAAGLGISLGEIATVYAAGGLRLLDALRVSSCCYLACQGEACDYQVLVLTTDFSTANQLAAACPVGLFIVLVLDAGRCFGFCAPAAVAAATQYLAAHGVESQVLRAAPLLPYHTPLVARHLAAVQLALRGLQPQPLAGPCYLATAGRLVPAGTVLGADYWLTMLQYPVNIHGALQAALADGYDLLLPFGADPLPFYPGAAQPPALGRAHLLPALAPDPAEGAASTALWQALTARGLTSAPVAAPPLMEPAAFVAQLTFDTPPALASPAPYLAYLVRQGRPLQFVAASNGWLVLDPALITTVLSDPALFSSRTNADFDAYLIGADPPLHTTNRRLFQPFFSPAKLAALGEFAGQQVAELAAAALARPAFDFVADFAIPLTQRVSSQLLGLTPSESHQLQSCLTSHAYTLDYLPQLEDFFTAYFQRTPPKVAPGMLQLLQTQVQAGQLTHVAAVGLVKIIWLASISTTSMLLSHAAHYLLTHPAVAAQLRAQPALIAPFTEELLRLEPSINSVKRVTTQPVTLGGQPLPAGALIFCSITAANRDPRRFPNPDELDLNRPPARHLTFGGGIHACLGAHLARLEAQLVVQWLLDSGTALRLTHPAALPTYFPSPFFRALAHLPVTLQPRPTA